jgi:hypothetical protein
VKRLFIKTYGCQMNVYDSERMADVLRPLGYAATDRPEDADLVVLNTCHIREKATEKVYSELGQIKALKRAKAESGRGDMTVVVAGCVAQAEGAEIMARAPVTDLVVGPQSYHQLPELIARASRARGERLAADFAPEAKFDRLEGRRAAPLRLFGLPDCAGGLRQILQLLRGALYARRRVVAARRHHSRRGAEPGRAGRARDHAAGSERQRLRARRLDAWPADPRGG